MAVKHQYKVLDIQSMLLTWGLALCILLLKNCCSPIKQTDSDEEVLSSDAIQRYAGPNVPLQDDLNAQHVKSTHIHSCYTLLRFTAVHSFLTG